MKATSGACVVLVVLSLLACCGDPVVGQTKEAALVDAAGQVVDEIMSIPVKQIPKSLLSDAQGIAIIPSVIKGGFVVGVRYGRGVMVVRDEAGGWRLPSFITITGGSLGWQIGLQSTDVVLVFRTAHSVQELTRGQFTLGADIAAAAGPVGREAAAAVDAGLKAEILSYSRSRGLFAGISLDGSAVQVDKTAESVYYRDTSVRGGDAVPMQAAPLPISAAKFLNRLAKYTSKTGVDQVVTASPSPGVAGPAPGARLPADPLQAACRELADSSRRLDVGLDEGWRRYLALPPEVFGNNPQQPPSLDALKQILGRYDSVAQSPQYQVLTQRPDFQATHGLLRRYVTMRTPQGNPNMMPPLPQ